MSTDRFPIASTATDMVAAILSLVLLRLERNGEVYALDMALG
jgi:hypothetical protein